MTRMLAVLLLAASCAHPANPPGPRPARPAEPEAVTLEVRADDEALARLVSATESHARARLEAQQHAVVEDAAVEVEVEIVQVGGVVRNGAYQYCVQLIGRVTGSADVTKERCEIVRLGNDSRDPVAVALATATLALTFETSRPSASSRLYLQTLDELTDALGRQAVRRD